MALALIGESLLTAVIEVLVDRIASPEVKDFFTGRRLDDGQLKKLKATMRSVGKLLNDAEEKQITDPAVKEWLDDLKDAVYEADDFLDEIAYKTLELKLEAQPQSGTCAGQVQNFLTSLVPCKKGMGEMQPELEKILQTLQDLLQQKETLGLTEIVVGKKPSSEKMPTTSVVDQSGIYGRDVDKEVIMKLLLSDDAEGRKLDVIPIVGMGGVGKTTLAQLVYKEFIVSNNRSLKNSFDLKAWVYVSEELDIMKVIKDILKGFGLPNCENMTGDQIHCELEKKLSGNKVLLVLDDVWTENQAHWEFLLNPFNSVRKGSKIVVTTRHESVALICSTVSAHHIRELTDDVCWLVLSKHAFGDGNLSAHPELEVIGREIAKKCSGLPLAAKTIGGLLRSKRDVKEWRKILRSNLWELSNDNVLSALQLSYHYLPSCIKQCFAYCAMFPKGYEFQRKELVRLWMAEGFLVQPKGNSDVEEIGNDYFVDLVSRSFFQQSDLDPSSFIMHDLINDLARSVSGGFCMQLEDCDSRKINRRSRHLTYRRIEEDSFQSSEGSCASQSLHTLYSAYYGEKQKLEVICNLLPNLKLLRVLSISSFEDMAILHDSFGKLKHLRYLNLSSSTITMLPDSICSLYNLEFLILSWCHLLVELPANIVSLINLRYLDIKAVNLQEMPHQMGKLTKLRNLSDFFVGKQSGWSIKELGELQHLRGELSICNLQYVINAHDALTANLKGKEHLDKLTFTWHDRDNSQVQEAVFEQLQPHENTKKLHILGYGGTKLPDWIGNSSLPLLLDLYISFCPNLKKALFTHFPSLTKLRIDNCEQLEIECFPLELFPKLESLIIYGCPNFVSFSKGLSPLPNLKEFCLWDCLNLKALPEHMHSLLPSLMTLSIEKSPEVESFPEGGVPSKLESLDITCCDKLIANRMQWHLQSLPALSRFSISHCKDMVSFPEETLLPSTLTSLRISELENLKSLEYKGLQHLTSLRELWIFDCPNLQSFPEEGLPSSLGSLHITWCPLLGKKCEKEKGEYWQQISHIPHIDIV